MEMCSSYRGELTIRSWELKPVFDQYHFLHFFQALLKSGATSQLMGADEFIVSAAEILLEQV